MKQQEKVTAINLIKTDISNKPDEVLNATIIRTLAGLEKKMEDIREALITEIK